MEGKAPEHFTCAMGTHSFSRWFAIVVDDDHGAFILLNESTYLIQEGSGGIVLVQAHPDGHIKAIYNHHIWPVVYYLLFEVFEVLLIVEFQSLLGDVDEVFIRVRKFTAFLHPFESALKVLFTDFQVEVEDLKGSGHFKGIEELMTCCHAHGEILGEN
jgi:hypothetical protein